MARKPKENQQAEQVNDFLPVRDDVELPKPEVGIFYEVLWRDIWVNREGRVIRVPTGAIVAMLPEIAAPMIEQGLIREIAAD